MEEVVLRLKELLFPSIADVAVLSVDVNIEIVRVDAQSTADGAVCPVCGVWSNRVHGSYLRFPADVPSGGRSVVLQLRVRRFTCRNSRCARRTFVEQISGLTRRHGRRTERLRSTLAAVGLALAGRAGARIARVLGVSVSRSTVLRLVDALPESEVAAPRVVGVDEYATRKGRHYGTVLVDIETRRPVDLLPDREASSLAAWLAERPGIEVYLDDRWSEGFTNAWKLWEEIVPLGYKGSYQRVRAYLHKKRTSPRPVTARPPSPRTVSGWILSRPETLTEPEQLQLKTVHTHCPELDALTRHVRSFAVMLTQRQGEHLPAWLDAVRQDDLPSLHTLAAGIDRDLDAVIAGLTLPWSSGAVEGHANRIKMLKRQMFGRAGFALLRKRVLLAR